MKPPLTPRQLQCVRLLCMGMIQKQIAGELGVSLKTIRYHLQSAYARTGTSGQVTLALWAVRNGVVKL